MLLRRRFEYADDIAGTEEARKRGLKINQHKTKYMKQIEAEDQGLVKRWRSDGMDTRE